MRLFCLLVGFCLWESIIPYLLELFWLFELEVWVQMADSIILHGRLTWSIAPLCDIEEATKRTQCIPQLVHFDLRAMNFQALELGRSIQHSLQGRIDISKVLKYFLGIRISFTTMSPIVIRETESIMHTILLVGKVLVILLPNALELVHVLDLEVWCQSNDLVSQLSRLNTGYSIAETPSGGEELAAERLQGWLQFLDLRGGRVNLQTQQVGRAIQDSLQRHINILQMQQDALSISIAFTTRCHIGCGLKGEGILMRLFCLLVGFCLWESIIPYLLELFWLFELEVWVQMADSIILHGRLTWSIAPLCDIEEATKRTQCIPQLVHFDLRAMNFQALELGRSIQHSLQGRIDISKVLKYFLGIRISLTTMSPIVIREAESIVHAILLVGEVLVVILPDTLELFHVLDLEVWC